MEARVRAVPAVVLSFRLCVLWARPCAHCFHTLSFIWYYPVLQREKLRRALKLLVTHSCPTLCNPMDYSPPGSPSMEFLRQEYWSGLPFPPPRDLPIPGIEPGSPTLQADSLPSEPPEKPEVYNNLTHTEQWNQSRWNWIHNLQSSVQNKNKWLFKKMSGNFKMATADH